ncbi:MAG TPA: 2-hydroxyacid dehydrogenase [Acetobacteraceae bacterium]|nr:2-hydroxyacid dehydrogenase [Acetobacteraceae bacterium]
MTERPDIAVIGGQRPETLAALEAAFTLHRVFEAADPLAALRAVGARVRGAASNGMAGLSAAQIEAMPNLEICAINGVGLETTDLALCRARNITVATAPVLYDDVADLAIALALSACRRIPQADRFVRSGRWGAERWPLGRKFSGMRAGLIGLGRIGTHVAARLAGFTQHIAYADPMARDVPYRHYQDAESLARDCDIVFLCAAGGAKGTRPPIVTRAVLDAIGPRGVFVNVARGWIVDEAELVAALAEGRLGAAGLDVFHGEPRVPEALLAMENVVLTPHIASSTEETMRAMGECVVGNLASWFAGNGALTPVEP